MKLAIGSDHAGFALKKKLSVYLAEKGYPVTDWGTYGEASVDYPDYAHQVAEAVTGGQAELGVLVCGSGQGVCMTANKHAGVRAALVWEPQLAALSRQHNNANVICFPARFISEEAAIEALQAFMDATFEGGRHAQRVAKME